MNKETRDLATKLRSEIEVIRHKLEQLEKKARHNENEGQSAKQESVPPPPVYSGTSKGNSVRTRIGTEAPSEEKTERRNKWKFRIEIIGAVLLFVYTSINAFQWKTAHDSLIISQRPWLGPKSEPTIIKLPFFNPLLTQQESGPSGNVLEPHLTVTVYNFGNSPAVGVGVEIHPFIMNNKTAGGPREYDRMYNKEVDLACTQAEANRSVTEGGEYLFQGHSFSRDFKYALPVPTKELLDHAPLMLVGCIAYVDQFNQTHHTRMCYMSRVPISKFTIGDPLGICTGQSIN